MVITTDDFDLIFRATQNLNRFNGLSVLDETGIWSVIGKENTVKDEMSVIRLVSKISTISIILDTIGCLGSEALFHVSNVQSIIEACSRDWPIPKQILP